MVGLAIQHLVGLTVHYFVGLAVQFMVGQAVLTVPGLSGNISTWLTVLSCLVVPVPGLLGCAVPGWPSYGADQTALARLAVFTRPNCACNHGCTKSVLVSHSCVC